MKLEFSWQIFEKYISNFMKIRPEGAELIPADGYEANRRFSQFWESA